MALRTEQPEAKQHKTPTEGVHDEHPIGRLYTEVQQARQQGSDHGTGSGGTYSNSENVRNALTSANQYVHSHGFPDVFITGTGTKGELLGQDSHGNKVHMKDGGKAGPVATDGNGHRIVGEQQAAGTQKDLTVPNEQGGRGGINADGSGVYNVDGGKQGAWGATRQVLEAQAHQRGMNDWHASNTDIANAQRRMAAEAGYHGKDAVNQWAKHLKPGEMHAPAADLRSASFSEMPKGQGEKPFGGDDVPSRDPQEHKTEQTGANTKRETESGYLNDSRLHYYGAGFVKDGLRAVGADSAADALETRTPYTTTSERDGRGVKSFTTKYGGDGAELQVRAASNHQDITMSGVTEAHGERGTNGRYNMTWTIKGKVYHGHLSPDGKAEFDN